jgi:hypothetical protein
MRAAKPESKNAAANPMCSKNVSVLRTRSTPAVVQNGYTITVAAIVNNASAGLSSKCRRHGRCEIGLRRTAQPVLMIAIGTGFATASHFLPRLSSGILAFRRKVSGRQGAEAPALTSTERASQVPH